MSKYKVTEPILGYEGKPLQSEENDRRPDGTIERKTVALTFREAMTNSLNGTVPGETLGAEEKARAYALTVKLYAGNEAELTSTEKTFIEERVAKIYTSPVVYGRVLELFGDNK